MKLFKNVDIEDLEEILENGILPISRTGNDNWQTNCRANNSHDVVYLSHPVTEQNTFTNYGVVLLEVEVENAKKNSLFENDVHNGIYEEYVIPEVKPNEIVAAYVPKFLKKFVNSTSSKIKFVDVEGIWEYYNLETKKVETGEINDEIIQYFDGTKEVYRLEHWIMKAVIEQSYVHPVFKDRRKELTGLELKIQKYII